MTAATYARTLRDVDNRTLLENYLAAHGERATVRLTGVCRQSVARVLAGLPVRRGTLALIAAAFAPQTKRADLAGPTREEPAHAREPRTQD